MEIIKEKAKGSVSTVKIGSGQNAVSVGGHTALPFLDFEGEIPNKPAVALEVEDFILPDINPFIKDVWKDLSFSDRVKKAEDFSPDLLCIKFSSINPDTKNTLPEDAAKNLEEILKFAETPLIVLGSGNSQKDADVLCVFAEILKGHNALLGPVVRENYKSIVKNVLVNSHSVIAETPLDINLAKQLNILLLEEGFDISQIVVHHSTAALGYGLEYCYSIVEKSRLAALSGDGVLSSPMINFVGDECWKTKEAKESLQKALIWEQISGFSYIEAGSDIIVVKHPDSLKNLKSKIDEFFKKGEK